MFNPTEENDFSEDMDNDGNNDIDNGAEDEADDNVEIIEIHDILNNPCNDEIELPTQFRCIAHSLALVAAKDSDSANQNTAYKKISRVIFAKLRAIWNSQARSTHHSDTIRQVCGSLFVLPVVTRWNSFHDSVSDFKMKLDKSQNNLDDLIDKMNLRRITATEIEFLKEFIAVTNPLSRALDILQGDKEACLGMVLPALVKVKEKLDQLSGQLNHCQPLLDSLQEGLEKRFGALFDDPNYIIASVTMPRFKTY